METSGQAPRGAQAGANYCGYRQKSLPQPLC